MAPARILTFVAIGVLFCLLVVFSLSLSRQLRDLSTTDTDNIQWSLSQVETELARLGAAAGRGELADMPDMDRVRFRADILLSRLALLESGRVAALFDGDAEADRLRAEIRTFGTALATMLDTDGALTPDTLPDLTGMLNRVGPQARKLALLGVSLQARQSELRRAEFSRLLLRTGGAALALLFVLSVGLIWMDLLLSHARKSDQALRLTTHRLSATVSASLDAIITIDQRGLVRDYNKAAEDMFGWPRDAILGHPLSDTIIPPQHRAAHQAGMERFLQTGTPTVADAGRVELTALRKSGEEFPVELNITSAREGNQTLFIAYLRDISQRIINEQGLIDARDRAERADQAKSQFMAMMSHEMRTPLNGILGVLDLLKTTTLTKQQARYTQIATASGEILLEHVNEALDITLIESGALALSSVTFELEPLVGDVVSMLEPLAREKGLDLQLSFDPPMSRAFNADAGRLRQILTNLIGNAIKFTHAGHVQVSVSGVHGPQSTALKIAVQDTGPGIDPENHEAIFQDFTSLAPADGRQRRNDGMGLAISRRIARLMQGDLVVSSAPGHGSVFTLTLPLQRAATRRVTGATGQDRLAAAPSGAAYSVLVVEDNAVNRAVMRDMLQGLGHLVTEASTGLEGVQKATRDPFDLIVMDISMPVMDGVEATRRIRVNAGPNRGTRIIGLTAHGGDDYRDRALAAGMDRLFAKPLRLPILRELVGKAEAETATPTAPRPVGGLDLTILTELKQVLGPAKLASTAADFFAETETTLTVLPGATPENTRQALHKIRGAAALLGLTEVLTRIDILSAAIKSGHTQQSTDAMADLHRSLDAARDSLANLP